MGSQHRWVRKLPLPVRERPRGGHRRCGVFPRKGSLSLYGLTYAPEAADLLPRLGKHKVGAGCLYVNKLDDVDEAVLAELIRAGHRHSTTVMHQD